jgi:hypothetical protein
MRASHAAAGRSQTVRTGLLDTVAVLAIDGDDVSS